MGNLFETPQLLVLYIQQSLAFVYYLVLVIASYLLKSLAPLVLQEDEIAPATISHNTATHIIVSLHLQVISHVSKETIQIMFTIMIPLGYFLSYLLLYIYYWKFKFFYGKISVKQFKFEQEQTD